MSKTEQEVVNLTTQQKEIHDKFQKEFGIKFLYKYRSGNDNDLRALRDGKIWISSFKKLNDPRDGHLDISIDLALRWHNMHMAPPIRGSQGEIIMIPAAMGSGKEPSAEVREKYLQLAEEIKESIRSLGVYSMTSEPINVHMWTHYANGFRGFCIEFPWVEKIFDPAVGTHPTSKVEYVEKLPTLDLGLMLREPRNLASWNLAYLKSIDYQQEQEWRFRSWESDVLVDVPTPISRIIFGVRAEKSTIRNVLTALQNQSHIKFEILQPIVGGLRYRAIPLPDSATRN